MRIEWTRSAFKDARRAPFEISAKLIEALARYAENREAAIDIKALQGAPGKFRIRVRDWRLVFSVDVDVITVTEVGPRGSVYR
jgi:mRNA-degrading endonuclease RelE of RelBE toxin-antitoxin system